MHQATRPFVVAIALLATLITGTAAAADAAPAAKWRIEFQGQATSTGELQFRVTPQAGEPLLFTVKIHSGRGEVYMAKDVLEGIKAQLPRKRFKSEVAHVREVYLKSGHEEPPFTLELLNSTVEGTKVQIDPV
jgi:hypothetical protein